MFNKNNKKKKVVRNYYLMSLHKYRLVLKLSVWFLLWLEMGFCFGI